MMKLFNTLTRRKEEFVPINSGIINMYVCGPTVYDLFHIGNARTFIFFDVVRRYMEYLGFKVNFVQNFTDIDDKIIDKATREHKNISEISQKYIDDYYKDADNLNIKRATSNPRATENVDEMINLICELLNKGFAYEIDGNVYFSIVSFRGYGKLFGQDLKTLKSGSRIEINKSKKDPLDFILWKKSGDDEVGYISPWGRGRPGWHTECCSMINKYFDGSTIDIHGGGIDLIFPHHENEIAQMEPLTEKPLANYWMHCSFLSINQEKMSKSLGNFLTARDILGKYSSNSVRFFMLSSHYRSELHFSEDQILWADKSLDKIIKCYFLILDKCKVDKFISVDSYSDDINKFKSRFIEKMNDDFNTADAISVIFELVKYVNSYGAKLCNENLIESKCIIEDFFEIMGINVEDLNTCNVLSDDIRSMIFKRYEFKKNKDFVSADLIRDSLLQMGVVLEDINGGVRVLNSSTCILIETILY